MTVPIHSFRDLRHSTLSLILLVAFAGIAGCANDNSPDGMVSPPDWVVAPSGGQHATSATLTYIANGGSSSCTECHGADLSGGNSKVSCFGNPAGCHHGPVADWVASPPAAQNHGVAAKKAPGSSGFASCQICHGSTFSGGGSQKSCSRCHVANAPHPARPWHGPTYTHVTRTRKTRRSARSATSRGPRTTRRTIRPRPPRRERRPGASTARCATAPRPHPTPSEPPGAIPTRSSTG